MWLILAAKQGHFKRVHKFVTHGVNVNAIDKVTYNITLHYLIVCLSRLDLLGNLYLEWKHCLD